MQVLHVTSELFPVVRTGGLGDVLGALPVAQSGLGLDVRVILPGYPAVLERLVDASTIAKCAPRFGADEIELVSGRLDPPGLTVYAIRAPALYDRPGNPYLGPDKLDWPDNAERFGLLGWCAAALATGMLDPMWRADILHAHDWHAGLAPAYSRFNFGARNRPAAVFTVHNLAFQGLFPLETAPALDLPASLVHPAGIEFWGKLSFIKAGLVYADRISTVSPGYAREIATVEFGCGLEGVIAQRGAHVRGILNGVDEAHWNPTTDPVIVAPFDADHIERRALNRAALVKEFGLEADSGPVFGVVSRLTSQKGIDLLLQVLDVLLDGGGSLVILGSGDADQEEAWQEAATKHPGRVAVVLGFDDSLSHRIFAGCDALLVPSRFEPGGLTQLYALRYGALPVVRHTGGLGDTVTDATPETVWDGTATGIVFGPASPQALGDAISRTCLLYRRQPLWQAIQRTGMQHHFLWREAAERYLALYTELRP